MDIIMNGSIYNISCKTCYLTRWINSTVDPNAFLITTCVATVTLSPPWYEDPVEVTFEWVTSSLFHGLKDSWLYLFY